MTIGIIGCGNISEAYLVGAGHSRLIRVKAVADLRHEAAAARAAQFGVEAASIDALLADSAIDLVVNLTVPLAHAAVGRTVVEAGKHVYSEKPLAATLPEARALSAAAAAAGVRVGCAPDTFMGGGGQACRKLIDDGRIGSVVGGAAAVLSHGMEMWHPNPEFFFKPGGGPALDIGPYYVTQLVNLLGPVKRVATLATRGYATRTIGSQPLAGQRIDVEVPTTINGALEFHSGANVAVSLSWDVWSHHRVPLELYGTEGSLAAPDPNFFGGEPLATRRRGDWEAVDITAHPFSAPTRKTNDGREVADYRIIGVLDMAAAIREGRPHRASGELALHALEVMEALNAGSLDGRHIVIETVCQRPAPVPLGRDEAVFLNEGGAE